MVKLWQATRIIFVVAIASLFLGNAGCGCDERKPVDTKSRVTVVLDETSQEELRLEKHLAMLAEFDVVIDSATDEQRRLLLEALQECAKHRRTVLHYVGFDKHTSLPPEIGKLTDLQVRRRQVGFTQRIAFVACSNSMR